MRYASAGALADDLRKFFGFKKRGLLEQFKAAIKPGNKTPASGEDRRDTFWK